MNYAVIAAGQGQRLAREGVTAPKPLVEIGGRPMIGRLIGMLARQDADAIAVIADERAKAVTEYLRELELEIATPLLITERTTASPVESLAAVSAALPDGRITAMTADTVFAAGDLHDFLAAFEADPEADAMMMVTPHVDDERPLYVVADSAGRVVEFADMRPEGPCPMVSGGVYGLGPEARRVLRNCLDRGDSRLRQFQRQLLADGLNVKSFKVEKIIDVDHASDLEAARRLTHNRL